MFSLISQLGVLATVLALVNAGIVKDVPVRLAQRQNNQESNNTYVSNGFDPAYESSEPVYPSPWMTPGTVGWEEAYEKAKAFVSQLTLLEKVNLTTGIGWQGGKCVGETGSVPRLGLRGFCLQDSPLGVRNTDYNSAFGSGQSAAASFDRDLWYRRGLAMGREHYGKGVTSQLGPVVGPLGRAPAGGRNWEGFSPDPYLSGIAVAASVKGIQDAGVIACTKHFIGNEQEHFRQVGESQGWGFNITQALSTNMDDTTLHELYLWPFADAVRAGTGSIMCSYNQGNNSYACQNSKWLNGILKSELGFQGFVMSDWGAQKGGVASAMAGLDMSMPGDAAFLSGTTYWGTNMTIAVLNGTLPEWRLDDMVTRIMAAYYKVGRSPETDIDPNFISWTLQDVAPLHYAVGQNPQQVNFHVDVRGDHGQLIREIGAKSTVLLKNVNNALPLSNPKFLAVIGEDAGSNLAGPNSCPDRGCNNGTLAMSWGSGTANFPYLVTPDAALQWQATQDGSRYESVLDNYAWTQIRTLVSQDSVTAIVFANADAGEGFLSVDGNIGDRNNLTLWGSADELIRNVSSYCNNTIAVIHSVGPTILDWYDSPNVTAILWAGVPGQESGNSITDVLYGKVNPAARTPFTWGPTRESYGADIFYEPNNGQNAPQDFFSEGVFIDYRAFDRSNTTPIYEFGHGLSYTNFTYSNLTITKSSAGAYRPTTGPTGPAPVLGNFSTNISDYLFPNDTFQHIPLFVYPYLNSTNISAESGDVHYGQSAEQFLPPGASDASSQPLHPAGGAPGGNAQLWDVLYTVTATISNTGARDGEEVPQLYVSLGGERQPRIVLRGFERLSIAAGGQATFTADLTRRDVSNWDTQSQNWVITDAAKMVYVGPSSRKLELGGELQ